MCGGFSGRTKETFVEISSAPELSEGNKSKIFEKFEKSKSVLHLHLTQSNKVSLSYLQMKSSSHFS